VTLEDLGILWQVELVDVNRATVSNGKQVTTMGEFDLTALFDLDIFVGSKILLKQIHHADTLIETNDQMETTRVERNTIGLFFEMLIDLKIKAVLGCVGPNLYRPIDTGGRDKWLLDAGVHTVNLAGMERQYQIAVVDLVGGSLHIDIHSHDLLIISSEDEGVFSGGSINTLDFGRGELLEQLLWSLRAHSGHGWEGGNSLIGGLGLVCLLKYENLALVSTNDETFGVAFDSFDVEAIHLRVLVQQKFEIT